MMTREQLKQMTEEARKDVIDKRTLVEFIRKDESLDTPDIWLALVDYSKAVSRYGALVDVLTFKDEQ